MNLEELLKNSRTTEVCWQRIVCQLHIADVWMNLHLRKNNLPMMTSQLAEVIIKLKAVPKNKSIIYSLLLRVTRNNNIYPSSDQREYLDELNPKIYS